MKRKTLLAGLCFALAVPAAADNRTASFSMVQLCRSTTSLAPCTTGTVTALDTGLTGHNGPFALDHFYRIERVDHAEVDLIKLAESTETPKDLKAALREYINELLGIEEAPKKEAGTETAKASPSAEEAASKMELTVAEPSKAELDQALEELLAERSSWGANPGKKFAEAAGPEPDGASPTTSSSVADVTADATGDLGHYLSQRDTWGIIEPKEVRAPLAKGAKITLPGREPLSPPAESVGQPIVHKAERDDKELRLSEPAEAVLQAALADLLSTRAAWGAEPSARTPATASATNSGAADVAAETTGDLQGFLALRDSWSVVTQEATEGRQTVTGQPPLLGTADLSTYLAQRATWGKGPKERVITAPLAKGAPKRLALDTKPAFVAGPTGDTIAHAAEPRPLPVLALVSQADIVRARNALFEERASWGSKPSRSSASATGDLASYLERRERWGHGPEPKPVDAPLAKGATRDFALTAVKPVGSDSQSIVAEKDNRPESQIGGANQDQIALALQNLLATRESWGTEPTYTEPVYVGDLGDYLARRDRWGRGPEPKSIKAPLAKGAPRKLEMAAAPTSTAGESTAPIINAAEERPLPEIAVISQENIAGALKKRLATRESWGTEPALSGSRFAGDLDRYIARRESWGQGSKARKVAAPLAKGAPRKLRLAKVTVAKDSGKAPIVNDAEDRPLPEIAAIPQEKISGAMKDLLATRESWGAEPHYSGYVIAGDLSAYLNRRDRWGMGPEAKPIKVRRAKGSPRKLKLTAAPVPAGNDASAPIINEAEDRPLPQVTAIAQQTITGALKDQLATRESWGTEPTYTEPVFAGDLNAYLVRRNRWGTGPEAKPFKVRLAKGAPRKLKLAAAPVSAGNEASAPIINEAEDRPLPEIAVISQEDVTGTLKDLLASRESWGMEPALSGSRFAGDLDRYIARRDGWGKGPKAKSIKVRRAKGAPRKLRLAKAPVIADNAGAPIVHSAEERPLPEMSTISQDSLARELEALLANRSALGVKPSMSKPSYSIVTGSTTAADGLSLDSYLARRDRWQSGAAGTPPPVRLAARDLGKARTITSCKKTLAKLSSESSILFATASAELAESSSKTLDELVKLIKACGDVVIRVEGHTDSIGKAENNLELSKARAKSVLEYLAKAGIDRSHLEAIGYGETKPIASNASNKTRALNRRIEFSVR